MARFSQATWRPIPVNYTRGGQLQVRGVVIHIMAGTLAGTDSWFRNSRASASSHFGTGKAGQLYQWVDTNDRAWAQANGNSSWLSIENEGKGGDKLTDAQLDRCAEVLAWAHRTYGVPLQVAHSPSGRGLGYHAMGGSSWGGHTSCPGSKIVAQLPTIVSRAKKLTGSGSTGGGSSVARYQVTINGLKYGYGAKGAHVTEVGKALVKQGCSAYKEGPGPTWTDADTKSYAKWQKKLGYTGKDADGVPGEASLKKLMGKLSGKSGNSKPTVSLKAVVYGATHKMSDEQKHPGGHDDVKHVQAALAAEGKLKGTYHSGIFDVPTKDAYSAWQRSLGYRGKDADGVPGEVSLKKLGAGRFSVKA